MSSRPDRARLRAALQAIVGADGVLTEPDELLVFESDGLTIFRATADAVVFPRSTAEVAACVIPDGLSRAGGRAKPVVAITLLGEGNDRMLR